jgi:hypothetical protein
MSIILGSYLPLETNNKAPSTMEGGAEVVMACKRAFNPKFTD